MISNPLEDAFYYLKNFQHVLGWISTRYDDLLSVEEHQFIADFFQLPTASQALWVRLVMRKGTHFRASKVKYPEIGNVELAVASLVAKGWVDDQAHLTLADVFDVLQKAEIQTRFKAYITQPKAKKSDWHDELAAHHPQTQSLAHWYPTLDDQLYTLKKRALCDRLRLMFFGNLSQSWSDLVLADLGLFTYEKVPLSADSRALQCRDDIDGYLHLYACREQFEAGNAVDHIVEQVLSYQTNNRWLQRRRARLLFEVGQHLERGRDFTAALQVYQHSQHPQARERRIRVLEQLGDYQQAMTLALVAQQAPSTDAEYQQVLRIITRLRRKLGMPALAKQTVKTPERLDLTLPRCNDTSVELTVVAHLHTQEAPVYYVENTLINALFGLLCWPAIFAPLPGAFFHPYQTGPADLLEEDFYQRRGDVIERCFEQLDDERYLISIRKTYAEKFGVQSPFVAWSYLSETLLEHALVCLPPAHLKHWFRRLLQDIKANRAGMPDLIQFWPAQKRYRMIEVKGPGDRLQDNQLRWLAFCEAHHMPVTVCYVQWLESNA